MSATEYLPPRRSLKQLRAAMHTCKGCELFEDATQVVPGEGRAGAQVVLVGEQPGDQEDRTGRPFVGPSGALLDQALVYGGIDRKRVYVTNAVKHFRFVLRGKRRVHSTPALRQVSACRPWLEAELAAIEPEVLVLLGATAARSLLGSKFRVTAHRGEAMTTPHAPLTFATLHPSALLRIGDEEERREAQRAYFDEFALIGEALKSLEA